MIDAEPALALVLSGERIEAALLAVASFVDLKTPYALGHARAVAELAGAAAERLDLPEDEVRTLRRAGLVHDLGRLGVSNAVWDKPGPLGPGEWERVRFQPYLTERMLSQSASLAPLAAIAVQHRERLDGSGYPRGLSGAAISPPARILGAADAYQAMCEPRPYRPPHPAAGAADQLRSDVRAGRLDGDAVEAVLGAAGHRVPRRREGPEGLTAREIEVLRLLSRGLSNREIGEQLVISPKTVGNHVEHIYAKIGASTRATASLFAVRHGLLPDYSVKLSRRVGEPAVLHLRELRQLVRGGLARVDDVADLVTADEQRVGQQPAVAAPPRRLGAHHRDVSLARPGLQPLQPARELLRGHVVGVALERGDLPAAVGRARHARAPAAELDVVLVGDALRRERRAQRLGVEVREPLGAREAADVGDGIDPVGAQERDELVALPRGMADGVDQLSSRPRSAARNCAASAPSSAR